MPRERVYTDEEIRALLRRATEIEDPSRRSDEPGLSLQEVEQVARESGIDPEAIRRAAQELELQTQRSAQDRSFPFLGASPVIDRERIVPGNMALLDWDEAVGMCRRAFSGEGKSQYSGNTREWVLKELGSERARVVVSPRGDETSIRVIRDISDLAWAAHGGIAGGMIGVTVILVFAVGLALPIALAASAASIAVLYMMARVLFRYLAARQDGHTKNLLDELESLIPTPDPSQPLTVGDTTTASGAPLDASLIDVASSESSQASGSDANSEVTSAITPEATAARPRPKRQRP